MNTNYGGIDYSLGRSNVNTETGIHYGVIAANSVDMDMLSEAQAAGADYGKPTCPKCGCEVKRSDDDTLLADVEMDDIVFREGIQAAPDGTPDWFDHKDFTCVACEACYWSDEVYGEEVSDWSHEANGYQLTGCLDNDVFVLASPYYTFAQYCSPCVPGAGNLDSPCADGAKTYCLGPEWFNTKNPMPYSCYRVADGLEVF